MYKCWKQRPVEFYWNPVFSVLILNLSNLNHLCASLEKNREDYKPPVDMCLTPFLILSVVELESDDSIVNKLNVADISYLLPVGKLFGLQDFKGLLKIWEEKGDRVGSAFFVGVGEVLELTIPGVGSRVTVLAHWVSGNGVDGVRVIVETTVRLLLEHLSASMTKKFMIDNLMECTLTEAKIRVKNLQVSKQLGVLLF
jgi:hypothetical protein